MIWPNKVALGTFITIGSALIFGFYPAATRAVYADGANITFVIFLTTFYRFISLYLFCIFTKKKVFSKTNSIRDAAENGFFQTLSIIGILGGMAFLPGPIVITIMFSYTLLLYFFLVFKKQEKISYMILATVIIAFLGLGLTTGILLGNIQVSWIGYFLALMASLATATRIYRYQVQMKKSEPAVIGAETFAFATLFCIFLSFYSLPVLPETISGWVWINIAAVTLSIGSFGMFYGISMIGAFKFGVYTKLEPVFGAIISFILINEQLATSQYVGMALVVGSLILYSYLQNKIRKATT